MLFAQLTWPLDKRANHAMWQTRVLFFLRALCPLTQLLLDGTHQVHVCRRGKPQHRHIAQYTKRPKQHAHKATSTSMAKLQLPNPAGKDKWQELIPLHPSYLPLALSDIGVVDGLMTLDEQAVDMAALHDAKYLGRNPRIVFLFPVSHMKILPLLTCPYMCQDTCRRTTVAACSWSLDTAEGGQLKQRPPPRDMHT